MAAMMQTLNKQQKYGYFAETRLIPALFSFLIFFQICNLQFQTTAMKQTLTK